MIPVYSEFEFDISTITPENVLSYLEQESDVADEFYEEKFHNLPGSRQTRHQLAQIGIHLPKIPEKREKPKDPIFCSFLARRRLRPDLWAEHGLDVKISINWDDSVQLRIWGKGYNGDFYFSHLIYSGENDLSQKFFFYFDGYNRKKLLDFAPIQTLQVMCLRSFAGQFSLRGVLYLCIHNINEKALFIDWLIRGGIIGEEYVENAEKLIRRLMWED